IFWHLGVRCALEERGFTFTSGFGPRTEPAPGEIGLLVGSSAGGVFSLLVAAGYDVPTILNSFLGRQSDMPPIAPATIFHRRRRGVFGYLRRVRNAVNLRASEDIFPGSGVWSDGADHPEDDVPAPPVADLGLTFRRFVRHFRLSDLLVLRAR